MRELCKLPHEIEWVELKVDNANPQEIGEYLSALSNAAALNGKAFAYVVWGVEDSTHRVVGTKFSPFAAKKGNEPLEAWLLRLLAPRIHFRFYEVCIDGLDVVVLEIGRAFGHPVRFQNDEFIRIGSAKKPLKEAPDRERALWRSFDQTPFEEMLAVEHVSADEVLRLIDHEAYFDSLKRPIPGHQNGILAALSDDGLIKPCEAGGWNITRLGAILFARRLDDFRSLWRKAMRVIHYRGNGRTDGAKERVFSRGYASGFEELMEHINGLLPSHEVIGRALRKTVPVYPEPAVRELVANALIHQDFLVTGAGPMVEIFADRIEITNPGEPLVDTQRFVDCVPKSRNETLASLMRRVGICEERGSGIDNVVLQIESFQLPAPLFEVPPGGTRSILFTHRSLTEMGLSDRVRACYLHACLKRITLGYLTNASLRERFGVEERNKSAVSRYIREAVKAGMIKPFDEGASRKHMKYVPFWA